MNPWRDFPKFTDAALNAFIKRFPSHTHHAAAVFEFDRRYKERDQRRQVRTDQPSVEAVLVGKGLLTWAGVVAIVGITALALAVLSLAFPIFGPKTQRVRRPTTLPAALPQTDASNPRSLPAAEVFNRAKQSPKPSATKTPSLDRRQN
jgi:hypothetical protein